MPRRPLLLLLLLYLATAAAALVREQRGAIVCGCHPECWCKRPGLRLFRWVFPVGHRPA